MKSIVLSANNYKQSFGTKLDFNSRYANFPLGIAGKKEIKDLFEKQTSAQDGELSIIHTSSPVVKPHFAFLYKNGSHKDKISAYILSKLPDTPQEYTKMFEKVLNLFKQRESYINGINKLQNELKTTTRESLDNIADIILTN